MSEDILAVTTNVEGVATRMQSLELGDLLSTCDASNAPTTET